MRSIRAARLTGGVVAFLLTPPVAALFLAVAATVAGDAQVDFFFMVLIFGTIEGFVVAAPVAFLLGALVGQWCSRKYASGHSRLQVLSASAAFMTAGGALHGAVMAAFNAAHFIDLHWTLVPVGGAAGTIAGTAVAYAITTVRRQVHGVQQAS